MPESAERGIAKYERLAEEVARAYMAGDAMAIRTLNWTRSTSFVWDHQPQRMQRRLPTWHASESRDIALAIADARHLVAKQFAFDSWDELVQGVASESSRPAGEGSMARTPAHASFYRVDEGENAIEVRGPISEADWDTVFAVMAERRLTGLKSAGQISDAALERLGRLGHVTRVDLTFNEQVSYAGLRHLARLPLEDLQLGGWQNRIDDDALAVLRDLPELRAVSLVWAQHITDAGVAHLAGCAHLESVNLMGTPTGDGALRALAGKARLAHVDAGTRVTPGGLATLSEFPSFANRLPNDVVQRSRTSDGEPSHLSLHPRAFVNGGLEALEELNGMFSLRLFGMDDSPPVTGRALEPLIGMSGLESLWSDPADDAMDVIAAMPRLRKLMCQDTKASDDAWIALARSTTIESIWGRRSTGLRGPGFTALSAMPALRALAVDLRNVDDASLTLLPRFPALRDLTPIGLGDDGFRHVGRCTELETLTCMYTDDVGDAGMAHVSELRKLRKYYAGDASITDRTLAVLGSLPTLERVELWNCTAVTNAGLAALARAPRLREVVLDGLPNITRDGAALFPPGVAVRITS